MRVIVTGGDGQLGRAFKNCISKKNQIIALGSDICDVTDINQIISVVKRYSPNVVIHCAAYTAVDKAETEVSLCRKINVTGTENIVNICREISIPIVFISSDYVFDGKGCKPYSVLDQRNALNQYGQSKVDAENIVMEYDKHYIIRTSWLFGDGTNFVKTISTIGRTNGKVSVVDDQIGSPTYTEDLSKTIIDIINKKKFGVYHVTNEGYCSWADLAEETFALQNINAEVIRISSMEYNSKAERPLNSRLSKESIDSIGIERLPEWKESLKKYITKYLKD